MAASTPTSDSESYQEEGNALLQYLRKVIGPLDVGVDGYDLLLIMPLNLVDNLAAGCLAMIIIDSGAVSTTIFVLNQDAAIIWSQNLKKWINGPPRHYFTKVVSIMSEIFVVIIDELNRLQTEQKAGWSKLDTFRKAKNQNDRFISEVVTRLIDDLLIPDQGEAEQVMRDFATTTEWLLLPGTMAINLKTRVVCERTKDMKTMRSAAFPFTWQESQSDDLNFNRAPTLIKQITLLDPHLEEEILAAMFGCLLGGNVEHVLLSVFGPGKEDNVLLFSTILKSILGKIEDLGKMKELSDIGEEYDKPDFLQGMFNYIIVRGGAHYWDRKSREKRALGQKTELLDNLIRVPSHDIVGWFEAVTTVDPDSKVSVNTLHRLYMEQQHSKIERNNFLSLIKKWVPGVKNNISRTSVNGVNNQYVIRGWRMHGEPSLVNAIRDGTEQSVRIMSLAEWFHYTYVNESDSFPFLKDIRLDYCRYLSSLSLPIESEKGFSTKLSNALPELIIKKKQGKIDGVIATKMRVWGWKRRDHAVTSTSP